MYHHVLIVPLTLAILQGTSAAQSDLSESSDLSHNVACWPSGYGDLTGTSWTERLGVDSKLIDDLNQDSSGLPARVDFVFVGDGYQAHELESFHQAVTAMSNGMFNIEPFRRYESYFRIHAVEVVSNDSGIDNDPVQGIMRDTALDMGFNSQQIPQLLSVNPVKLSEAARNGVTTDVDIPIAVANTTRYGGTASFDRRAMVSGHRADSHRILTHELAHAFGGLHDEYNSGGTPTYTGPETQYVNTTIFNAGELIDMQHKWYRWIGVQVPGFENPTGTYEGAMYHQFGIYRPSTTSMMRSISRNFNLPGAEEIIRRIYREVPPIEDATPNDSLISPSAVLHCFPMTPEGTPLTIEWFVDGEPITEMNGSNFLMLSDYLPGGSTTHSVSVRVIDPTPWVIDPNIRDEYLTQTIEWTVGTCTNSFALTHGELNRFFDAYTRGDRTADVNQSGSIEPSDMLMYLRAIEDPCSE